MRIVYTLGIYLYTLGVRVASLWHSKARLMCRGWKATFSTTPLRQGRKTVWFHASSMGEFEQARPVLEQLKKVYPECRVWVTFFSPSGYEVRKNYPHADRITYLPMDTPRNARRLVDLINPNVVFFVKYDFWFNILGELYKRAIPTYLFSSIFRPQQYFFRWYGGWFCKQLKGFTNLFVQNSSSVALLKEHGISQCSIAGDTRFDRVHAIASTAKKYPEIEQFIAGEPVLMAGSSWEPDEKMLQRFIAGYSKPLKVILAPHVIGESHLESIERLFGKEQCVRYSHLGKEEHKAQILIIDNIGMLSSLYQYATVAYIGGGWGKGIHNILEALTFGKPVLFGPNYHKFQEAVEIIHRQGGCSYSTYEELAACMQGWLNDPERYNHAASICHQYVAENLGASNTVLEGSIIKGSAIDSTFNSK